MVRQPPDYASFIELVDEVTYSMPDATIHTFDEDRGAQFLPTSRIAMVDAPLVIAEQHRKRFLEEIAD